MVCSLGVKSFHGAPISSTLISCWESLYILISFCRFFSFPISSDQIIHLMVTGGPAWALLAGSAALVAPGAWALPAAVGSVVVVLVPPHALRSKSVITSMTSRFGNQPRFRGDGSMVRIVSTSFGHSRNCAWFEEIERSVTRAPSFHTWRV